MTNNVIGLRDGIGSCARSAKIRNEAGKRDGVSGAQRNDARSQRPLGECYPHHPSPTPNKNILAAKKFPRQRERFLISIARRGGETAANKGGE